MKVVSWVSAHAGLNRELCLSVHGHLPVRTCHEKSFKYTDLIIHSTCDMGLLYIFNRACLLWLHFTQIGTNQIDNYQCVDSHGHSNTLVIITMSCTSN